MSNETEESQVTKQAEDWFEEGQVYYNSKQYEQAAISLKKATELKSDGANELKQYEEALTEHLAYIAASLA